MAGRVTSPAWRRARGAPWGTSWIDFPLGPDRLHLVLWRVLRLFTDDRRPARLLRSAVLQAARHLPPLQALVTRQLTGGASPRR